MNSERSGHFQVVALQKRVFVGDLDDLHIEFCLNAGIDLIHRIAERDLSVQSARGGAVVLEEHGSDGMTIGKPPECVETDAVLLADPEVAREIHVRSDPAVVTVEAQDGIGFHEKPAKADLKLLIEGTTVRGECRYGEGKQERQSARDSPSKFHREPLPSHQTCAHLLFVQKLALVDHS